MKKSQLKNAHELALRHDFLKENIDAIEKEKGFTVYDRDGEDLTFTPNNEEIEELRELMLGFLNKRIAAVQEQLEELGVIIEEEKNAKN
ncbi:hypothetical protein GWN26_06560, partial [Candidatus Saccharibacteria bacterium]|nr:hypothetical protein [Candidatus Saccharibacteria bacterium]NIV03694.1 hypothetical protein [Calditrichia bacterium]NIS38224.1 hypothetical protein [Candidatus Saccharibacteria bacterium]NIV72000.1 hypothetical protein [Calditrichia bacterium]NIV98817.1 hypothetical protein [Candidatus Saccharibacteria bacterium]